MLERAAQLSGHEELARTTPLVARRQRLAERLVDAMAPQELERALEQARLAVAAEDDVPVRSRRTKVLGSAWARDVTEESTWTDAMLGAASADILKRTRMTDRLFRRRDKALMVRAIGLTGHADELLPLDGSVKLFESVGQWLRRITPADSIRVLAQADEEISAEYTAAVRERYRGGATDWPLVTPSSRGEEQSVEVFDERGNSREFAITIKLEKQADGSIGVTSVDIKGL